MWTIRLHTLNILFNCVSQILPPCSHPALTAGPPLSPPQVLNRARKALPAEQSIWITAAQLEEANGNNDMADKIVARALKVRNRGKCGG